MRFLREDCDMRVGVIVTDRHRQIRAWIRDNLEGTQHFFDVWHVASGRYLLIFKFYIVIYTSFEVAVSFSFCGT